MGIGRFALPLALAGVAAGILAADLGLAPPSAALLMVSVVCLACGALIGPSSAPGGGLLLVGVVAAFAAIGTWRHDAADPSRPTALPSVAVLVDGTEHELTGTVMDDPRPREDRIQLVLGDLAAAMDGRAVALADRLLVWMPRGIDAGSGDRLGLRARIELAEDFDGFAYREYLARQGVGAIGRPRFVEVVTTAGGPGAMLAATRRTLLDGLNSIVPEPEAALGAGILLGVRASIAPEINDAFATAGLTHVVAISGWNIAIVAALLAAMARPLERRPGGHWTTAFVAASTVGGYVVLTGASPSVVRAALMAGAMLVARLGGSRAHAASALGLAALVMLLAAPAVLWDVGFQLSLLATGGLIWFGAAVERRLPGWPAWIREPVALTLAAQLTTLPVILVNFERLSLVAPLANVLVVPFVPIAMLFSCIASLAGVLDAAVHLPFVGDVLTWFAGGAAWLVLRVIVTLGTAVASLPYAAIDASIPAPIAMAWLPILGLASWALGTSPTTDQSPDERTAGAAAALGATCPASPPGGPVAHHHPAGRHGRVASGWGSARDDARHRPGRRDPRRGSLRRDDADRRRSGPRADSSAAWCQPSLLRSPHRPAGAEPSAPGSRRRAGGRARPVSHRRRAACRHRVRESGVRSAHGRCLPGVRHHQARTGRPATPARSGHLARHPVPVRGRCCRAPPGRRHQQRIAGHGPAARGVCRASHR